MRPLTLRLAIIALLVLAGADFALAIRRERLIDSWRPVHYAVDLTLDQNLKEIVSAETRVEIVAVKPLSVIDFDFGELTTDKVTINSSPVTFAHKDGRLTVNLPETLASNTRVTVAITYHGKPKDGLILTNDKDGKPSAVGDNWPDRVHHWIPCLDHPSAKATVTFRVTTSPDHLVVANGRFNSVETHATGSRTWTYIQSQPIPPYCMVIIAGGFAKIESPSAITRLDYYVAQSDAPFALKGFGAAAPSLKLFSETIGPYPYDKLAMIIGATRFGGMENSSAIVFADNLFARKSVGELSKTFGIPSTTVDVVAHEIAHQWFGDSVTESTWSDLWLSEGFASYFANVFIQREDGEEAFQSQLKEDAQKVFAYEKRKSTPLFDTETENLFDLLNPNNYQKGSWVLHMLRSRLGDEAFFSGIRSYYESHKHSTATSDDLRQALEKSSGKDLKQFFARWIYDRGHPQYEVQWQWVTEGTTAKLTLKQVQASDAFLDPVQLSIVTASGRREIMIKPTGKIASQTVQLNQPPLRIEVDPNNLLLKEVR
jgi:aminopeptidase N